MSENETHAEIVKRMQNFARQNNSWPCSEDIKAFAVKLDAANRREVTEAATKAATSAIKLTKRMRGGGMSVENETIKDIAAESRSVDDFIDTICRRVKIRKPSKSSYWAVVVEYMYNEIRYLAGRNQPGNAAKRELNANSKSAQIEFCNAAKMREALSDACYAMFNFLKTQSGGYEEMANALDKAKAALAEPARNCDRFGGDPKRLHHEWWEWSGRGENCDPDGTVKLTYGEWLLARVEGGRGDGSPRAKEWISGNDAGK